jgi:hypothetical protein
VEAGEASADHHDPGSIAHVVLLAVGLVLGIPFVQRVSPGMAKSTSRKSTTDKGSDIPSTIQRSGKKAQETWAKAHDSAADSYGDGERAHRTAFSALKHTHEKVGDHWEPKEEYGPSDEQAATGNRSSDKPTAGGVDANASKKHLQDVARRLDVKGRSKMDKTELVDAIQKANNRATAKARG